MKKKVKNEKKSEKKEKKKNLKNYLKRRKKKAKNKPLKIEEILRLVIRSRGLQGVSKPNSSLPLFLPFMPLAKQKPQIPMQS